MKHYLIKLNQILKFNKIYLLLFISLLYSYFFIKNEIVISKYSTNSKTIIGRVKNIDYYDNYYRLYIDDLIINCYSIDDIDDYSIGDKVKIIGEFSKPNSLNNLNIFDYKMYLYSKRIHYIVKSKKIELIDNDCNIFYKLKRNIYSRINNSGSKEYLNIFILGNNNYVDDNILKSYQYNGISHLFSLSGMHISVFTLFISFVLNKIFKNKSIKLFVIASILLFYIFIANYSLSLIRAIFLYLILMYYKNKDKKIYTIKILLFLFSINLIFNPYTIYNTGFIFSYVISFSLVLFQNKINKYKNYFIKILITSLISFLVSIPILINNYYSVNLLTPLFNLVFVPIVSIIIFPLSLLTFIFPFLEPIFNIFTYLLEQLSFILSNIKICNISFCHIPGIAVIIYYYFIYLIIHKTSYKYIIVFILILIIHHNIRLLDMYSRVSFINVGQGDTILLSLSHNKSNILIDCAGNNKNIIIPYLKSQGISYLDYLIITHGDYDHMGESINLINNFKVKKVIFNCGEFNDLEQELIKELDKKKIPYYSCIKELNIKKNKLYFLQTKIYDNENDNSNVIYTVINNYKFMFMGDAGVEKEKDILDKYNISNIDVLKVGHHGSKTSSSTDFINEMNPKYSIISVGKNNRYGHPNKEVLDNLNNSKIYRTDEDGSILFKIKNNNLKVETCTP